MRSGKAKTTAAVCNGNLYAPRPLKCCSVVNQCTVLESGFSERIAKHPAKKIEARDIRETFARIARETTSPKLTARTFAEGRIKDLLPQWMYAKREPPGIGRASPARSTSVAAQGRFHRSVKRGQDQDGGMILILASQTAPVHFNPGGGKRARSNCGFPEHAHRQFTKIKR